MTKNKRNHKLERKVHDDGKAISTVEKAVHNLKGSVHSSQQAMSNGFSVLPRLLGSQEEQEAAWLLTLSNCRRYDARVPTSQVVGAVPVDLYRKTEVDAATATSTGKLWVMTQADCWSATTGGVPGLLHADGASSTYGTKTGADYPGSTFPAYATLSTGMAAMLLGNVSAEFTSDANVGTEYLMVANITTLRCYGVPNAAADAGFSGRVQVFYTLDPERHPIAGQTAAALESEALQQSSMIFMMEYTILRDGRFVPILEDGEWQGEPLTEISAVSLPLSVYAYYWRRIGANTLASPANVIQDANVGFYIEGVAGAHYEFETTYLWQTERYATNKVTSDMDDDLGLPGPAQTVSHIGQPGYGYDNDVATAESWKTHTPPVNGTPLNFGNNYPGGGGSFLVQPAKVSGNNPQPVVISHLKVASHTASNGEIVPGAVQHFGAAVAKHPGMPIHPSIAPLAVVSNFASKPGMHRALARELAADPRAIDNVLADRQAVKLAAKEGPDSAKIQHKRSWNWKSILKGVWDVAKVVGPAVMALL